MSGKHTRQNRNAGSTGPGLHRPRRRIDPTEADLKVLSEPEFCWCGEQHDGNLAGDHPWPKNVRKPRQKKEVPQMEPVPYARKLKVVMTEEVSLPLPADLIELQKIMTYVMGELNATNTPLLQGTVGVDATAEGLTFTFTTAVHDADRPSRTQADTDRHHPEPPPFATTPDAKNKTTLQARPDLAEQVLRNPGTFYFHTPTGANPQKIGAIRRSLTNRQKRLESLGIEVAFEMKVLTNPKHTIEVTVVR